MEQESFHRAVGVVDVISRSRVVVVAVCGILGEPHEVVAEIYP
jgi:hypothetical protein